MSYIGELTADRRYVEDLKKALASPALTDQERRKLEQNLAWAIRDLQVQESIVNMESREDLDLLEDQSEQEYES